MKSQGPVAFLVLWVQRVERDLVWHEIMQQGTKGKATVPTRCEVRNFHPLSLENVFLKNI